MNAWGVSSVAFLVAFVAHGVRSAWTGAAGDASWIDRLARIKNGSWNWLHWVLGMGAAVSMGMWAVTEVPTGI